MDLKDIDGFISNQLEIWPLAKKNYNDLKNIKFREMTVGNLKVKLQFNPARILSTGAKIDAKSLQNRKCFLCKKNRPVEQSHLSLERGWHLLVNPYPIFSKHLTIANVCHIPQDKIPFDAIKIADILKGMAVFFNGASAGASAPDHLHLQAVEITDLPLLLLIEKCHNSEHNDIKCSDEMGLHVPFRCYSLISPDNNCQNNKWIHNFLSMGGPDINGRLTDTDRVNWFIWYDSNKNLRCVVIPRKEHRPSCWYDEEDNIMVSPGCVDMAGVIICPRENDFLRLDEKLITEIYNDVALTPENEIN